MMGAETLLKEKLSYEEYMQLEEQEDVRYEYYNGEVVAMSGVSLNHSRITSNINRAMFDALENTPYEVFQEGAKLAHGKTNAYVYPDIIVTCSLEDIEASYILKNPSLIVEVISPSTAEKDRGEKLSINCTIPSLRYYLLINQNKPYVEIYSRDKSFAVFHYRMFQEMNDVIELPELHLNLTLEQIYRNVRFAGNDR